MHTVKNSSNPSCGAAGYNNNKLILIIIVTVLTNNDNNYFRRSCESSEKISEENSTVNKPQLNRYITGIIYIQM